MTTIYLAYSYSGNGRDTLKKVLPTRGREISLLVSFSAGALKNYRQTNLDRFPCASLMLDSGAYTAWQTGKAVDIDALIAETKDPRWNESVALDVIGDSEASVRNALRMKAAGSPAFSVFHFGDPWEHLAAYKANFGKVGLSCRFGEKEADSLRWLEQCFARAWPKRFHSFGWTAGEMLERFPFDSADSSSWAVGPAAYGNWKTFGKMSVRGIGNKNLEVEIDWHLKLARRLAFRWRRELALVRGGSAA